MFCWQHGNEVGVRYLVNNWITIVGWVGGGTCSWSVLVFLISGSAVVMESVSSVM